MTSNVCFLNSNNGYGLLAFGGEDILVVQHVISIDEIDKFIEDRPNKYIFLCLSYDLKNRIESLSSKNKDNSSFPDLVLLKLYLKGEQRRTSRHGTAAQACCRAWQERGDTGLSLTDS